ncbi:MAG TPA: hypothetical protein DC013_10115 [Ruminococcaceae bacterium]|jgi:hypothetical protein|nr:hypothetical protein [Oscillospiraceae bacterium]
MKYFMGEGKKRSYFEGWYLKHRKDEFTLSLIPGVSVDREGVRHAFLQVITKDFSRFVPFPADCFSARKDRLEVRLGCQSFSESGVKLNLARQGLSLRADIRYGAFSPLRRDVMGPLRFLPFLECSHGIISRAHGLSGYVTLNGEHYDLTGGTGYIEKDLGRSFPKNYVWTQCSGFPGRDTCITAAAADVPFGGISLPGCFCSVYDSGREYRLATYTGARADIRQSDCLLLSQGKCRFRAELLRGGKQPLLAPAGGNMTRIVCESAVCTVRYRFSVGGGAGFDLTADFASFESAFQP